MCLGSCRIVRRIYKRFGNSKDYDLKTKTKSTLSISSNIAEDFDRKNDKEAINFLSFSRGSCAEFRSQIYIGLKNSYIPKELGKNGSRIQISICNADIFWSTYR